MPWKPPSRNTALLSVPKPASASDESFTINQITPKLIHAMKTSHKRLVLILLAAAVMSMIGTSCNTLFGIGKDVEHVGDHIENAAR
jgi:predicted small secreted protein